MKHWLDSDFRHEGQSILAAAGNLTQQTTPRQWRGAGRVICLSETCCPALHDFSTGTRGTAITSMAATLKWNFTI